jgi:hypothetical protein
MSDYDPEPSGRDRVQMVISLGEGDEGRRLRALFDDAAESQGKALSAWARQQLLISAMELVIAGKISVPP